MVIQKFKRFYFLLIAIILSCSTNSMDNNELNEDTPAETDYNISAILQYFEGTGLNYELNGNTITFTTQDLPNHTSPYWPVNHELYETYNGTNPSWNKNPNNISTQSITLNIPLKPAEASNHEPTSLGAIGVARNGVVFYNQYAGPNNQPLTFEINSFDQWLGHPQQFGQYHYHQEPTYLTTQFGEDAFLGLLSDGFPVYGPLENGERLNSSDLDEFHGHTGPTEDFPDGIYHYHITADDPYINGNGYFGTPGNISN
jgi:hypothetical protein